MGDLIEEYGEIVVLVILGIGICAAFIKVIGMIKRENIMGEFLDEYGMVILYVIFGLIVMGLFGMIVQYFVEYGPEFINSLA